uniref:C-type lectin domain-containing protein n=1 Tax=Dicentrarchus labrax TaxID=13489 RepID=A0A8C4EH36_DICLA
QVSASLILCQTGLFSVLTDESYPKCEYGWEQHGRQCYYFSTNYFTWSNSRDECRQKGGDLVQIDSREEQVKHTAAGSCKKEGTWLWVDGSPLNERFDCYKYIFCQMGEKAGAPDLKCWFDESCKYAHRSICEKPA